MHRLGWKRQAAWLDWTGLHCNYVGTWQHRHTQGHSLLKMYNIKLNDHWSGPNRVSILFKLDLKGFTEFNHKNIFFEIGLLIKKYSFVMFLFPILPNRQVFILFEDCLKNSWIFELKRWRKNTLTQTDRLLELLSECLSQKG